MKKSTVDKIDNKLHKAIDKSFKIWYNRSIKKLTYMIKKKYKNLSIKERKEYHYRVHKKWVANNIEKVKKYQKAYQQTHPQLYSKYYKKWRIKNKKRVNEWHREYYSIISNKIKRNCRNTLNNALRYNKIKKGICVFYGNEKVEAHHNDYLKPLEVVWLCKKCHLKLHKEIKGRVSQANT